MTDAPEPTTTPKRPRATRASTTSTAKASTARKPRPKAPTSDDRRPGLPARTNAAKAQEREALEMAHRIVDLAADKKAADIVLLNVGALTSLTDYFVICSGGSDRQLGAIADGIVEGMKAEGALPIGREGAPSAHWVLVDFGSVIVHVMAWPERDFYQLEKLWAEAPLVIRVQ